MDIAQITRRFPIKANREENLISSKSSGFVRKYLTGIFLIICLIVLSVFWGFHYKASALIKEQLRRQGHAFYQEVILMREWASSHGGVYVKLTPGMEVNPYLLKVPGLKVVIKDQDDETYTLKNPALMTREISELAAQKGIFKFRITSLRPLNPSNAPDHFEQIALAKFESGIKEYFSYEHIGGEVYYRYMAPLVTQKECLRCHAHQDYREGDVRGGISVTITATDMMQQLQENRILLILSAIGIVALIFAIIRFISRVFIKDLKSAEDKLVEMATKDFLTGLLNRREMFNRLTMETHRANRQGKALSIIMIDIDRFKEINDTYGHQTGDYVLKQLSRCLMEELRDYDILSRYGGEEFLIAVPGTPVKPAQDLAERLREKVMKISVPSEMHDKEINFTISAGVTQLIAGEKIEKTISRADVALYKAKEAGRNRIVVA